jgi:mannose-6-phosphate isomerase-like protein (cupin superfamily)
MTGGLRRRSGAVQTVNLAQKLALITDCWSPKAVGEVNGFHVKLVKLKGEFVWHAHEAEDELFLVLAGTLRMQLRERELIVREGEFLVVPHGTEHRPVADGEAHVLLFEPGSTVNTGTAGGERTRAVEWI